MACPLTSWTTNCTIDCSMDSNCSFAILLSSIALTPRSFSSILFIFSGNSGEKLPSSSFQSPRALDHMS